MQTDGQANGETTLEDILALIEQRGGIDFRPYRRTTIERRTLGRMRLARTDGYGAYFARLLADPDEMERLIDYLTIKVSRFFRNTTVFDLLRQEALPDLARRHSRRPLRIWSAGCGNGEEAYSLAILLEELALDGLVLGTDIDERALAAARAGRYRADALADAPPETVAARFAVEPGRNGPYYEVDAALRARVEFVRHDLTAADGPIADQRFDLISCRNVLIYLNLDVQERVQHLLARGLGPGGYLCLGEAEWLAPALHEAFAVVDRQARLFRLKGTGITEGDSP